MEHQETTGKKLGAAGRLAARASSVIHQDAPTVQIPLDKVDFDPQQPRIAFHAPDGLVTKGDEQSLAELAESIRVNGLIHPVTVSETADGRYLVRVGERRTRATKLLGLPMIAARVRNDLTGMRALALQMAENTERQDLTPWEISQTIKRFVTKSPENPEPMTRRDVAAFIGMSAGNVTRYMTFADDELQKKWVEPGYVDTPENLYAITLLPAHIQELAYASLSTGKIDIPLSYAGKEYFKGLAKAHPLAVPKEVVAQNDDPNGPKDASVPGEVVSGSDEQVDFIAAALAGAGADGVVSGLSEGGGRQAAEPSGISDAFSVSGDGYQMPVEEANELRLPTFQVSDEGGPAVVRGNPIVMVNSAVPCRMPMRMLGNLITKYGSKIEGMDKIEIDFRVPSSVAVNLVRELTGDTVQEDVVQVRLNMALALLM